MPKRRERERDKCTITNLTSWPGDGLPLLERHESKASDYALIGFGVDITRSFRRRMICFLVVDAVLREVFVAVEAGAPHPV
jgi:hypothetical protein